jgi:sarcosine oxidase
LERNDAIVLGAGVIGSAAAYALAARGQRTLLLERHAFGHHRGSSHGGSRIFRHAYEDVAHVRLAVAADAAWTALEAATGERLLQRTGGLDLGRVGGGELDPIEASLRAVGSDVERLSAAEVRARFPAFAPDDDVEALYQPSAGIVPASRAVAVLQRAAAAAGAELRDLEQVTGLLLTAQGVEVATEDGRFGGDRLVVAAGAWLGEVLPDLALPLYVERQQVLYVAVGADARPFAPERMPLFIARGSGRDQAGGIYGFPLYDVPNAIKVSDHQGAPRIRLDERTDELHEDRAAATVAAARRLMPSLTGRLVSYQTCLYTKTPDERFVLDRHPEYPHVVVAGGGSGHAFKFGPLLGSIAADLALDGATAHGIEGFALARFAPPLVGDA